MGAEVEFPRIDAVKVVAPTTLNVRWRGKRASDNVDLIGWIATGGETLAVLMEAKVFSRAAPSDYGAAVSWDEGEGDLSIDALHLKKLADEQKPFGNDDVRKWQVVVRLSNNEAADLVGVSLSTWNTYRADAAIPQAVAITCRATLRDPILLQAHLKPRVAGRPRKEA